MTRVESQRMWKWLETVFNIQAQDIYKQALVALVLVMPMKAGYTRVVLHLVCTAVLQQQTGKISVLASETII